MAKSRFEELDSLQKTLNHAIDTLRYELIAANLPPLSLQATEPHPLDDCSFPVPPRLYEARRLALASMGQLKSLLSFPYEKVSEEAYAVYDRACLDVLVHTGLVDYLAEAASRQNGVHVDELQKALDMDGRKLTIVLRYLSTNGWVRETEESVFALNRPGFELLPGKNGRKRVLTPNVPDIANSLVKWLQHPEWKYSDSSVKTAFQLVHNTDLAVFDWVKDQPDVFVPFAEGIRAVGDAYVRGVLSDYPWKSLAGTTIIDIGGGQGTLSIQLAKEFPELRFIVQDLPEALVLAKPNIESQLPGALEAGRFVLEAQDFFKPQCRKGDAYTYMFRHVLHDWAFDDGVKILKMVAEAAGSSSKILIIETVSVPGIVSNAAIEDPLTALSGDKYEPVTPPAFIPANLGWASKYKEGQVLHLLNLFNAQGRTLAAWTKLTEDAGLKISKVHTLRANVSVIECLTGRYTNGVNGASHTNGSSHTNGAA
ncbi:hypothetical protein EIP86_000046 [Pleurotus ostreatoroseus]|nr:hypothetical protein EIP86_000046 [Pleurotus ostreatoroseus]